MKVISLLIGIFMIGFISANGLTIINNNDISINKTYTQDKTFSLTIKNEEAFKFYNITIKESLVDLPKFDLEPGQNKTVQVTIDTDNNYNGVLTILGNYQSNLGASNETEIIYIDYQNGFDRCNLNIIKGDRIIWMNNVLDEIKLVNEDTGVDIGIILEGQNYTRQFSYPEEFDYYASRIGLRFTEICHINVMDDSGFVHNSEYDDILNFKLNILYPSTTLDVRLLKNNYTINFNGKKEDIMTIENTGTKVAKNIHIEGEWMTFNKNDFDLNAGDSINVGYTIEPDVFQTEQTNKTYNHTLKVTGNFETINKPMNIFVPYEKITDLLLDGEVDESVIENFFKFWCKENPESSICQRTIVNGTGGQNLTVPFSVDTIRSLLERQATKEDEQRVYQKQQTEIDMNQTYTISNMSEKVDAIKSDNEYLRQELDNLSLLNILTIMIIFVSLGGFFVYRFIIQKGLINMDSFRLKKKVDW